MTFYDNKKRLSYIFSSFGIMRAKIHHFFDTNLTMDAKKELKENVREVILTELMNDIKVK
jgi:hypothetical protein